MSFVLPNTTIGVDLSSVDGSLELPRATKNELRRLGAAMDVSRRQEPLRVMVIRSVSGAGGGAEKIILRTAETADPMCLDMTVCAIYRVGDQEFDLAERGRQVGAKVIPIPQRRRIDPTVLTSLTQIRDAGNFDVIHSHDYKANYYALKLARKNLPTVSTAHGWTGNLLRERWLYYPMDKRQLSGFSAIIGVSSEICNELISRGVPRERLHTILNGVNAEKYRRDSSARLAIRRELAIENSDIVVGAVGRLEKQKRFDLLIETFARLSKTRPALKLLIVGTGTLFAPLQSLIRKYGIADRCSLLGHREDMHRVYQAFDMYVQSSEYEGTPTVLVEAMAMQIPIVATDVGGTTELVYPNQHALIVPPHDIEALATAIAATVDNPEAANQRIAQARRRTEHELSFAQRTTRLMGVYESVIRSMAHQQ